MTDDELIEKAWADFVNCRDDQYFGNRSKLTKQKDVLRKFAAAIKASGIEDLRQQVERLETALAPFAKAADVKLCGVWGDEEHFGQTDVGFYLTFGDLRAARAALTEKHSG